MILILAGIIGIAIIVAVVAAIVTVVSTAAFVGSNDADEQQNSKIDLFQAVFTLNYGKDKSNGRFGISL